eukprot:TRINITY_DN13045_c0_g1_i1.p1 TRINITY_DN13045_c0_g1~~TRINITY_DN13045_c0_g1_i1.p1  ORF type:complete len:225 (+),score=43.83 TRINITY_DN13045_c0_g1_i1:41-676(+)
MDGMQTTDFWTGTSFPDLLNMSAQDIDDLLLDSTDTTANTTADGTPAYEEHRPPEATLNHLEAARLKLEANMMQSASGLSKRKLWEDQAMLLESKRVVLDDEFVSSEEARERERQRLERNRSSARRSRLRKKERMSTLLERVELLEKQRVDHQTMIEALLQTNEELRLQITQQRAINAACSCGGAAKTMPTFQASASHLPPPPAMAAFNLS